KIVKQLDRYGCTIACLSMILGIQYFELREILHKKVRRLRDYVTEPNSIGFNCVEFQNS
ncbi:hypothetical protein LCGC14_1961500, partial [marine sediment metagenome]